MPKPTDLNSRIALAKGWTWTRLGSAENIGMWHDPQGELRVKPDYVGTLAGVAGMMRELGPEWGWGWSGIEYDCSRGLNCGPDEYFRSPEHRPGDCVGEAWLSVFGKEAADAS